ncbi:hypothetical protein C2869_05360 [Saccharobesus litoralis]|uniref:Cytochrome c domain-containing protein n=1 Tax=Saccharobesus litoralis TaxID=2172099 RepID=A0A2S0VNX1_9ALTE|nr:c-type cytochrome [Saccharobesus litoralis]AWB65904.1 hypothetical protein C2869_05360 [Saccharobesus litoralis]
MTTTPHNSNRKVWLATATWLTLSLSALPVAASSLDKEITKLSQQPSAIAAGKKQYDLRCASCHDKDLSGAMGFNLKDGEWVHGSKPSEIYNNVSNGFLNAGMPPFGMMLKDQEIKEIVAYVMSKREGWDNLTYKVFPMKNKQDRDLSNKRPTKSGQLTKNIADFQIPEETNYAIVFEGDFYVPFKGGILKANGKKMPIEIEIDGQPVKPNHDTWRTWKLKEGKQHLKFTYYATGMKPWQRNLDSYVTLNNAPKFPVSTRSLSFFKGNKYKVLAKSEPLVQRKKLEHLPHFSIAVGFPTNINYAFNTRTCSVVGMWKGDMLDIGPNINQRGQDASKILGDINFKYPQQVGLKGEDNKCEFIKYTREGNPEFQYKLNGTTYALTGSANNGHSLNLHYKVLGQPASNSAVFTLPKAKNVSISSSQGQVTQQQLTINLTNNATFDIKLDVSGSK